MLSWGKERSSSDLAISWLRYGRSSGTPAGYAGGNILNLQVYLKMDLRGRDSSQLTIRQADLREVELHDVNLRQADVSGSVFTDSFSAVRTVAFVPTAPGWQPERPAAKSSLWQVPECRPLLRYQGHTGMIWSVCFSPDGRLLASGGHDRIIRLWDVAGERSLATLRGHTDRINSLSFSPDGCLLASSSWDRSLRLWEMGSYRCLAILTGHTDRIASVAWSP